MKVYCEKKRKKTKQQIYFYKDAFSQKNSFNSIFYIASFIIVTFIYKFTKILYSACYIRLTKF